ncbi:MAG: HD-GYP domain-containing protein [Bacteriovoracaceae bacterium]
MGVLKIFEQNSLSLKLVPISIRELFLLNKAPCDFYGFVDGLFHIIIKRDSSLNSKVFKNLIEQSHWKLFMTPVDREHISYLLQNELQKSARSLSIGNIHSNIAHQSNLLTLSMGSLYNDPMNDSLLKLQFQAAKNLSSVLISHKEDLKEFYADFEKQKHFFMLAHPLLSSMVFLGFLDSIKIFNEKEIEQLFVTCYFKDIGMSFLPPELFTKKDLTEAEKDLIKEHASHSVNILKNRVPLHNNYLHVIANHHCLNNFNNLAVSPKKNEENYVIGLETVFMGLIDTIVAATAPRPFREKVSLFVVLDKLKEPVIKSYATEFKALVYFLRRFYLK